jgi:hypothetical protein
VLNNPDVLAAHLRIEERMAVGNPSEVIEQAKKSHEAFLRFKDWLAKRQSADEEEGTAGAASGAESNRSGRLPTFREWLAEQESRPSEGP